MCCRSSAGRPRSPHTQRPRARHHSHQVEAEQGKTPEREREMILIVIRVTGGGQPAPPLPPAAPGHLPRHLQVVVCTHHDLLHLNFAHQHQHGGSRALPSRLQQHLLLHHDQICLRNLPPLPGPPGDPHHQVHWTINVTFNNIFNQQFSPSLELNSGTWSELSSKKVNLFWSSVGLVWLVLVGEKPPKTSSSSVISESDVHHCRRQHAEQVDGHDIRGDTESTGAGSGNQLESTSSQFQLKQFHQ